MREITNDMDVILGCQSRSRLLAVLASWRRTRLRSAILVIAILLSAAAFAAEAQAPGTGAISGTVFDPSSSTINGAGVTVMCQEADVSRETTTTTDGTFGIYLLPPGPCSVTVAALGFQSQTVHTVMITVSETAVIDLRLPLATSTTTVNVPASQEIAQTESASLGHVVYAQQIVALPLANRNFTQILGLSPGVEVELTNAAQFGRNSANISAAGANTTENNFQFNGIDANNIAQNSASGFQSEVGLAIPAPDTVDEFKVQTAQYSAEYGR